MWMGSQEGEVCSGAVREFWAARGGAETNTRSPKLDTNRRLSFPVGNWGQKQPKNTETWRYSPGCSLGAVELAVSVFSTPSSMQNCLLPLCSFMSFGRPHSHPGLLGCPLDELCVRSRADLLGMVLQERPTCQLLPGAGTAISTIPS